MAQQLALRRARPLDVVNLYRLISEQGENDLFDLSDEARALAFVLDVIVNGYVLVAETKAGRLVGSIGFARIKSDKDPVAGCFWFVMSQPYLASDSAADLLDLSLRSADHAGLAIHFARSLPLDDEVLTTLGFKLSENVWKRRAKKKKTVGSAKEKQKAEVPPTP